VALVKSLHSLMQSRAADADGTPDEDYRELTAALKELEMQFGNYYFVDLHRGGDNGFTDGEYGDFEHLNRTGSRRLSLMLGEHVNRILEDSAFWWGNRVPALFGKFYPQRRR